MSQHPGDRGLQVQLDILKLQEGDREMFRRLVQGYKSLVFNTCLGFVKSEDDADDLTQEVFVEVFESIQGFKGEALVTTWIYRIAVNKSLEFIRKKKSRKRWAFLQSLFVGGQGDDLGNIEKPDSSFHPGIALENRERATILYAAIDRLPENQRTAFTLHKVEGLPHGEIAAIMRVSLATVESLIFRARKNLQKSLYNYYQRVEKK